MEGRARAGTPGAGRGRDELDWSAQFSLLRIRRVSFVQPDPSSRPPDPAFSRVGSRSFSPTDPVARPTPRSRTSGLARSTRPIRSPARSRVLARWVSFVQPDRSGRPPDPVFSHVH